MIEYEKRAMIEAEDKYTFRQSTQISMPVSYTHLTLPTTLPG